MSTNARRRSEPAAAAPLRRAARATVLALGLAALLAACGGGDVLDDGGRTDGFQKSTGAQLDGATPVSPPSTSASASSASPGT